MIKVIQAALNTSVPERYQLKAGELGELLTMERYTALCTAFKLGFIQGMKCSGKGENYEC